MSSFHIEALRIGATTGAERARIEHHLSRCVRCKEGAEAWQTSRREFETGALHRTRASVRMRAEEADSGWWRQRIGARLGVLAAVTGAATLILLLGVPRRDGPLGPAVGEPDFAAKGGFDFIVAGRRGDRVFHVDAEPVRPGDQIRFVLDAVQGEDRYVMVGSIDSAGRANIYVPYDGSESIAMEAGKTSRGRVDGVEHIERAERVERVEIEGSIVLDGTPGPERIFCFLSRRPLSARVVREGLKLIGAEGSQGIRSATTVSLPAEAVAAAGSVTQRTVLLEKGPQ